MLSLGALTSASGAANYYIKAGQGQISGYYSGQLESSKWGGGAKEMLGLKDGPVELKRFEALLDGQVSKTQTLGRMVKDERLRDPGRDFTFSAPKSVSLAAIGELEKPILEIFSRSVERTMSWYEANLAQAKVWDKEQGKQVKTGDQKILYASFMDFLSRGNDAQLHMHTPVVNLAVGKDGKVRSLNFDLAYKNKILLGNIQRAELARGLQDLGLQTRPAGKNGLWELEGSSTELLAQFSKRRQDIIRQAPHKINDPAALAHMAKITRPAKVKTDPGALKERWDEEFKVHGTSVKDYTDTLLNAPQRDKSDLNAQAAIDYAAAHLSETEEHFDRLNLLKHAMISVYGNVDIKTMEGELETRVQKGELLISEDGRWLKPAKTHRLEQKLLTELEKGHLKAKPLTEKSFEAQSEKFEGFKPGQLKAAELILTDHHRFTGVDGVAGTGKTYLLKETLPLLKDKGFELIGIAPSHKALQGLTDAQVFDQTLTVQKFVKNPRGNSNTVLVVDEAGMVGNEKFHEIMHYANSKNLPRVVFMGDKEQLPPIEAGRPFEFLQDNGLRTARMDDIVRQKKDRHVKGVLQLSRGELRQAFQTLNKEVHEVKHEALETYALKLRDKMNDPAIIVNTNAECQAINNTIKSETKYNPASPTLEQKIWNPFHMSKAEKMRAGSYEGATHIRFARDVGKTLKRGEIYRISKVDHERAELVLTSGGKTESYRPAHHGSGDSFTQVYTQSQITLHEGDQIKFRQTDRKLGVSNNDFGRIESISNGGVTIQRDNSETVTLDKGHRMLGHLNHAWANTAYSFQGATVQDNIAIMRADNNPLNTLASLYVGSSRHQDNLAIVTDDKDRLLQIISEKLELDSEPITFREPPGQQEKEEDLSREPDHEEHVLEMEKSQDYDMDMAMGM